MKHRRRWVLIIVLSCMIAGVLSPALIGWYLQHHYAAIYGKFNKHEWMQSEVIDFKRGWFRSEATLRITHINTTMSRYLMAAGILNNDFSGAIIMHQAITHGPWFYPSTQGAPYYFGLALIKNRIQASGVKPAPTRILEDIDRISLGGDVDKSIKLSSLVFADSTLAFPAHVAKLEGRISFTSNMDTISANLILAGVAAEKDGVVIAIPRLTYHVRQAVKGWTGSQQLSIESMNLKTNTDVIQLSALNVRSEIDDDAKLAGDLSLNIKKIQINDYIAGPVLLHMMIKNVDATAASDMLQTYLTIKKRGELYVSQLRTKILMLLPSLFMSGTTLQLNDIMIQTQDGKFAVNATLRWDESKESVPEDVIQMILSSNVTVDVSVSKKILFQAMNIMPNLPLFNKNLRKWREGYLFQYNAMTFFSEVNFIAIKELVNQGLLAESDAAILLYLQKNNSTVQGYQNAVQQLLLSKHISKETSFILLYWYTQAKAPLEQISALILYQKNKMIQQLAQQWGDWVKQGLIKQKGDDYFIKIKLKDNQFEINNKLINPT